MFFTKKEVAQKFRVTERTVDNWVDAGVIDPPIKLGVAQQSRVRFPVESIATIAEKFAHTKVTRG